MAKKKKSVQDKTSSPVLTRLQVQEKLETVLAELKSSLGDKKFRKRMKKAGKLISRGLDKKTKVKIATLTSIPVPPAPALADN